MASNPGRIPAGGRDVISVVVHTRGRGAGSLKKKFTVFTNDPKKPRTTLIVGGKVKEYVRISPEFVSLAGDVGQPLRQTVKVMPYEAFPFKVKGVSARDGQYLRFELKPLQQKKGPQGYQLVVQNTRSVAGNYNDTITIQTDSKVKPELHIPVYGRIKKPVSQTSQNHTQ